TKDTKTNFVFFPVFRDFRVFRGSEMTMRMPAEWEPHRATWVAWPHHEPDWLGKLATIPWVYAEIVRVLAEFEPVEILCQSTEVREAALVALEAHGVNQDNLTLHKVRTDRVWLRDSAPTGVIDSDGNVVLLNWKFNGWAKYPNFDEDASVGNAMARLRVLGRE